MNDDSRTRPADRFSGAVGLIDLSSDAKELLERAAQSPHGHAQRTLYRHGGATIAMFAFRADSKLPPHAADGVVSLQVLSGQVRMIAGDDCLDLAAGHLVRMAPGCEHDLCAPVPSVVLLHVCRS